MKRLNADIFSKASTLQWYELIIVPTNPLMAQITPSRDPVAKTISGRGQRETLKKKDRICETRERWYGVQHLEARMYSSTK